MKIVIISNSLNLNSGFSEVAKNLCLGLRRLGHSIHFIGMQTAYVQQWCYGIEMLPLNTFSTDELTQYMIMLQTIRPDVCINIFQSDTGDLVQFPLTFKKTIWHSVVEGDVLPHASRSGYKKVIENGGRVVLPSKHGYRQCELDGTGIDMSKVDVISYGYDDKVFRDRIDDTKYCFYSTDIGKIVSNPEMLCKQGCFHCHNGQPITNIECPNFKEETVNILVWNKDSKRWEQNNIKIGELPTDGRFKNKIIFGIVKQNFGVRHRMERLLKAFSIFISESKQIRDRAILHLHCFPMPYNGINLIDVVGRLGIEENVVFSFGDYRSSGWSDRALAILYNTFDCYCSASSGEGLGIPTIEAMACGVPVVGPRSSAFVELVEGDAIDDNNNKIGPRGLLCDGDFQYIEDGSFRFLVNEKDLASKMKEIYNNKELRERCRKNCLSFVKDRTWDQVILKWDNLLKTFV